ncbi:two-component sensor histidine kinase [Actinoplanes sp. NBRC 14428]|nr:two-component sensor histidine kinase [Actinoplanes sp. NBRC 14428]
MDPLLAAAFTALAFVPWMATMGSQFGDLPQRPADAFALVLVLAQTVPLAVRTRWPAACLAVVGTSWALYQAFAYPPQFSTVTVYLAIYSVAAHQRRFRAAIAITLVAAYAVLALIVHRLGSPSDPADLAGFALMLSPLWVLGAYVRRHRADEVARRQRAEAAATAEERARIARELHDVVTHHVTAIVVQADAARMVAAPEVAGPALATIEDTGRRALSELRALLDVLEEPRSIRDLVERNAQPATLVEDADLRSLPATVQLVAYRVVQEGLTNAAKYAAGQRTAVRVTRGEDDVRVEVTNPAGTAIGGLSGGRGLSGLRDRVGALGGSVSAAPLPDGGFRLHARIPT